MKFAVASRPFCRATKDEEKGSELDTAARMNTFLQSIERRAFIIAKLATKNDEDALDIVQDAMLKLVQKYSHHAEDELGALFHTILQSKINDWHRRQAVRNRWRIFFHTEDETATDPENMVAQALYPEPDHQFLIQELGERLLHCIGLLPLRQQQAIILRAWEGYDIAQTARIMKCSEGSVKTHYSRAIHSLRSKLEDHI